MAEGEGEKVIKEGNEKQESDTSDFVSKIVKDNSKEWETLIGKRNAIAMQKETKEPLWKVKDRGQLNSRKRAKFVAKLGDIYKTSITTTIYNSNESKNDDESKKDDNKNNNNDDDSINELELVKPLDSEELLDIKSVRGDMELNDCKNMEYCYDVNINENEGKNDERTKSLPNSILGNFLIKNNKGIYYYETVILDNKLVKNDGINIGWVTDGHNARVGVGENPYSYGWNCIKGLKLNEVRKYGKKWNINDIIGIKVDLKDKYIEYYINGNSLGKAFLNINNDNLVPGITLSKTESVTVYINKKELKYLPKNCDTLNFDFDKLLKDNIVIDGNILASIKDNGIILDAQGGFPTAILKLKNKLSDNKSYYYEVKLNSAGLMQIGYVNKLKFNPLPNKGEGVGDDDYSYGFDGSRANKWGKSYEYFKKDINIKNNDNIGCLIDLNKKEIKYYLNGKLLGTLFKDFNVTSIKPGISLPYTTNKGKVIQLLFSKKDCKYFPKNCLAYDSGISFRTKDICNKLKNYGYQQYKKDYKTCSDSIYLDKTGDFDIILKNAGNKLVCVDFWATWCGPCLYIAPFFNKLATQYIDKGIFLKVDVDKFNTLSKQKGIQAMPTFQFYRNGKKIDEMRGANVNLLTSKVKKYSNPNYKPLESKIIQIKSVEQFNKIINDKSNKIIIVDWSATWCGPCKAIKPVLIEMSNTYKDKIIFLNVDVDEMDDLAQDNGIQAMPTFHFYKNNKKLDDMTIQGANQTKIQQNIDKLL